MKQGFWPVLAAAFVGCPAGSFVFSQIAIPVLRPFYQEFIEKNIAPALWECKIGKEGIGSGRAGWRRGGLPK